MSVQWPALAYRAGTRHRLDQGAPGLAILAALPARAHERTVARARGYAVTHDELQPGASGIACPPPAGDISASVGVVTLHPLEVAKVVPPLRSAARAIARTGMSPPSCLVVSQQRRQKTPSMSCAISWSVARSARAAMVIDGLQAAEVPGSSAPSST